MDCHHCGRKIGNKSIVSYPLYYGDNYLNFHNYCSSSFMDKFFFDTVSNYTDYYQVSDNFYDEIINILENMPIMMFFKISPKYDKKYIRYITIYIMKKYLSPTYIVFDDLVDFHNYSFQEGYTDRSFVKMVKELEKEINEILIRKFSNFYNFF